jgi:putative endonuclease
MTRDPSTVARGMTAQRVAERALQARGCVVTERNFRCVVGEIDLIAYDGDELVFVEVRSRGEAGCGRAEDTVGEAKQRRIARVADLYLSARRPVFASCRFDVVGVNADEVEVFVDAFRPRDPLAPRSR